MLEELLVLGLQQGIARAGLSQDKKRHGGRPRRESWTKYSAGVRGDPRSKSKGRTEKKVRTVDAFTVEEKSRNFARKKKCKAVSHTVAVAYITSVPTSVEGRGATAGPLHSLLRTQHTMEGLFFNVNGGWVRHSAVESVIC